MDVDEDEDVEVSEASDWECADEEEAAAALDDEAATESRTVV